MNDTMQAIFATEPGGPEVLQPRRIPVPTPAPGEVLIRVAAAGINRPDLRQRQGGYPPPPGVTEVLGLEVAGTIVSCGSLDDPQLFGATPAATAATIRDDFNFRHEHVLRDMPKPPASGPSVRSKMGPVQPRPRSV